MSSDSDSIEPFIDNLWYYDSVMSSKPSNRSCSAPPSPSEQTPVTLLSRDSSLPLSTGGLSSSDSRFPETYLAQELEYCPSNLNPSKTTENEDSQTQVLPRVFAAMDDNHDGELSKDELYPWMEKLGLQYAEDGMIQKKPNDDDWSTTGNLDSIACLSLNEPIDKESKGAPDEQLAYNKSHHITILDQVFRLFDKDHDGFISREELRETFANLGLLTNGQVSFTEFSRMMDENPNMGHCLESN